MTTTIQTIETPKHARALDTSGNNNHGQIYSGRGLEFDGVTDYLSVADTAKFNIGHTDHTLTGWFNTSDLGSSVYNYIVAIGNDSTGRMSGIGVYSDGELFVSAYSSPLVKTTNSYVNLNTWYRITTSYNASTNTASFYLNGKFIEDKTIILDTNAGKLTIGAHLGGVINYTGMISDVQVWNKAWTTDDVAYDYLNPESLVLNRGGTSLTNSNLLAWYPMQDGHRGHQSYILDASNTGLGDEIVSEGDFGSGGANWTVETGWTDTGGSGAWDTDTDSGSARIYQTINTLVVGKSYKLTFKISNSTNGRQLVRLQGATNQDVVAYAEHSNGEHTVYFTSLYANTEFSFYGHADYGSFNVDNISVKPVNDKNPATTVFYGSTEKISATNDRTFAGASNWADSEDGGDTAGGDDNSWTEDSGTYNENTSTSADESTALTAYDGTTVTFVDNYLYLRAASDADHVRLAELDGQHWEANMVVGRTYRLSYAINIASRSSGSFTIGFGETTFAPPAARTYGSTRIAADYLDFVYLGTTTHAKLFLHATVSSVFEVFLDNFSIKEIGTATGWTDADQQLHIPQTALQSYNELAWTAGGNETVQVSALAADLGTNNFVISYVIHPEDVSGENRFLSFEADSSSGRVVHKVLDGVLKIYIQDDTGTAISFGAASGAGALVNGNTYHIIESFDRTSNLVTTYINGEATGVTIDMSSLSGDDIDCDGRLSIYQHVSTEEMSIQGFITEVALWKNTTFNADKVNELYNDGKPLDALIHSESSTLYGYWRNNGLSTWVNLANPGTKDSTANTMTETLLIPAGVDSSRDSQGFIMNRRRNTSSLNSTYNDDINPYVDLGSATTIAEDSAGSIMCWLKPLHLVNNYFMGANSGEDSIRIASSTTISLKADNSGIITFDVGSGDMVVGEWFHFAATKDTDNVWRIYIDGVQNGSARTTGTVGLARDTSAVAVTMDQAVAGIMSVGSRVTGNTALDAGNFTVASIDSEFVFSISSTVAIADGITLSFTDVEDKDEPFDYEILGARRPTTHSFDGDVDGFLIYSDLLSLAEVKRNYNATKGSHTN